jgi:hypothetical protein
VSRLRHAQLSVNQSDRHPNRIAVQDSRTPPKKPAARQEASGAVGHSTARGWAKESRTSSRSARKGLESDRDWTLGATFGELVSAVSDPENLLDRSRGEAPVRTPGRVEAIHVGTPRR